MRSRSSGMEAPDSGRLQVKQPSKSYQKDKDEGNSIEDMIRKSPTIVEKEKEEKVEDGPVHVTDKRMQNASGETCTKKAELMHLSKDELLRLLSIMEGEVQAREDIIHMLQSEKRRPESLEAQYGSAVPVTPLQALQRDRMLTHKRTREEDVYEVPMMELDHLEEKHRETYRRMLEQLLLAEKFHRRTVTELECEKRKHVDFMNKSDDFTNLLEHERERLKKLLEQEKAYQTRKDKDHCRQLEKVREELVKLKSFALMLVDERQLHIDQIDQQSQKIMDLDKTLQERDKHLENVTSKCNEDSQRIQKLEVELEHKAAKFSQEHEDMTIKLSSQESQNRQLRTKLTGLCRRIEELEDSNKALQKSEKDLQELRDKISRGECGNSTLMAELETLRKKVLEMEGKDEEITKAEAQCKELRRKLQDEESHSRELKLEIEKLQKRMANMEKLEGSFNMSKSECTQLHSSLEREKNLTKNLTKELEMVKNHVKELQCAESRFEKAESSLKDDLTKLKSFTVILVDERKNMAERLKQEEKKSEDMSKLYKTEQSKVMEITEKLIEESKKLLKLKSEMEMKVTALTKEKNDLRTRLACEEEKQNDLNAKVNLMQKRVDCLEEAEKNFRSRPDVEKARYAEEDNKVKELTEEIDRLKNRLKQLEVVEGDLMKTEDEYDMLEKKFRTEQDKANVLSQLLEEMKSQIARNKAIEKGEAVSQEAELRLRCKMEEAKTRDLQADVLALKEKIHELMNKEDQLSQLQVDYAVLQQRLIEEQERKKNMSQQILNLTKELEVTKRYSRALRPSMNGRRIVDVPLTSTAVQTDEHANEVLEEETPAVFIRKSVLEENHVMSNLRQKGLKKTTMLDRYSPTSAEISMKKSLIPWMKKKESSVDAQDGLDKLTYKVNGDVSPQPSELTMSQKPGRPLHIRVTPDHQNSTATLEITSPRAEDFFSSTTIIPTLGLQKPRITIVPKPTTVSPKGRYDVMDRTKSPVTITTFSRAKSPEQNKISSPDSPSSPVSVITVSTSPVMQAPFSPDPQEASSMGRAIFKVTPEKQTVATPVRKFNSNTNIITTEDNKIHIHLGSQFKRSQESGNSPTLTVRPLTVCTESKETPSTGTVLRSPRQSSTSLGKSTSGKMTSSITITPITSAPSKPTQSVPGTDVQSTRSCSATRIPMSKGMKPGKTVTGLAAVSRIESRAESQSMKIELKKSAIISSMFTAGGKS